MAVVDRIRNAWNAFRNNSEFGLANEYNIGPGTYHRPDRPRLRYFTERSLISSIYTRIAVDVSDVKIRHVKVNEQDQYSENIDSTLNQCLTLEANLDQSPRQFRQDIVTTMIDKGVAAIVPVDTVASPENDREFEIFSLRVGEIIGWYPRHVKVSVYNEDKGIRETVVLEKRFVAIVENPFYSTMNEPSSTLQRLIRKLNLLDVTDENNSSGKLDMIIQLPYVIKSEARRQQAEQRRKDIEFQLKGSQYGIAYTDGTEKITQLNRPVENNLQTQIEFLVKHLYDQLGITDAVMNGSADEATMINYMNRTIYPIVQTITEAMQRAFLQAKLLQQERIMFFRDPFKFVPVSQLADVADKFTRNEILTSNEIRSSIGFVPSKDPKADKLQNSNMPQPEQSAISEA